MATLSLSSQCMQIQVPFEYVPLHSELIIEGTCVDKIVFWNDETNIINTAYKFEIHKFIKGEIDSSFLWVMTKGGRIDNRIMIVYPELEFEKGFNGVLMLNSSKYKTVDNVIESNIYEAWAMDQSVYTYDFLNKTAYDAYRHFNLGNNELLQYLSDLLGSKMVKLDDFDVTTLLLEIHRDHGNSRFITGFFPDTITAGTNQLLTITGSNFGVNEGVIFFRNANSTNANSYISAPNASIVSWSNTNIQIRVPSNAGTGKVVVRPSTGADQFSNTNLQVLYNISSFSNDPLDKYVRYVCETSVGAVEYQMNSNFSANVSASESFNRAIQTWKCLSDIHWVQGSNTSINVNANDNTSVIRWSNGEISYPVVGQYNGYFFSCSSNPSEWYADEFDVMFLPDGNGVSWEFGPGDPNGTEADFETAALHELGHALIMGHVSDSDAVMYPLTLAGTTNRIPDNNGLAGALFSIPKHQAGGINCSGYFPMTPNADIIVSNLNNDGTGSLRQAVKDVCPDKEIYFQAGLNGQISVQNNPIVVDKSMNINGPGVNILTLSGNNMNRILDISPNVSLLLSDLKLINGFDAVDGGAIFNQGELILSNVTFQHNFEGSVRKAYSTSSTAITVMNGLITIMK